MKYLFTIPRTMPNLNDYLAAERVRFRTYGGKTNTKGNELKKQWQMYAGVHIRKDLRGLKIEKPVKLHYKFFEPNAKRDMDNVAAFAMKVIQDALVRTGVLENDGWKQIMGFQCEFYVDRDDPRIEVEIVEVD